MRAAHSHCTVLLLALLTTPFARAYDGDLASTAGERGLWGEATRLLPEQGIEAYTQGLMDLGATICMQRSPHCLLCPVRVDCIATQRGTTEDYPVKSRKLKRGRVDGMAHHPCVSCEDRDVVVNGMQLSSTLAYSDDEFAVPDVGDIVHDVSVESQRREVT